MNPNSKSTDANQVPNLAVACQIINLLDTSEQGFTAIEIERQIEVAKSTLFRILKTLTRQQFLQKQGRYYCLGSALLSIGVRQFNHNSLRSHSEPLLDELAQSTGYSSLLAIPNAQQALVIAVGQCRNIIQVASHVGQRFPLYCSAVGKVFLAYDTNLQKNELAQTPFKPHTRKTIVSSTHMLEECARIVARGYALEQGEYHQLVRGIAVPINNNDGQIVAALSVLAPSNLLMDHQMPKLSRQIKEVARKFYYASGLSLRDDGIAAQ